MGHRIAVIDPFGVTGHPSDRLNPLDLFSLPGAQLEADAEMLAALLGEGHEFRTDPFWTDTASGLISGLIAHVAAAQDPAKRSMAAIRKMLYGDDVDYNLAVLLDKKEHGSQLAYDEIAAYLQICSDKTRPSVLSTARTFTRALNSAQVAGCLENSTIKLEDIVRGEPLDVFITIPPEKLKSHRNMLKMLVGTLLTAITRRKVIPPQRTLFVLDEAASLGKEFEPLLTACTLLRGYGMQVLTAWQDVSQIKSRYPTDWPTILNNAAALLTFGAGHYAACKDLGELTGIDPKELMTMKADEAVLSVRGEGVRVVRRMDYLKDRIFSGKSDPNPFYAKGGGGKSAAPG